MLPFISNLLNKEHILFQKIDFTFWIKVEWGGLIMFTQNVAVKGITGQHCCAYFRVLNKWYSHQIAGSNRKWDQNSL